MQVETTEEFDAWLRRLRDANARIAVLRRIALLRRGNPGDSKRLGPRLWELRLHQGPGYRLYYTQLGDRLILLLAGGTKRAQRRDIRRAERLADDAQRQK